MEAMSNHDKIVVKMLLEQGANPEITDLTGTTPLSQAVQIRSETIVTMLLENDVDLEAKDSNGRTALWWAVDSLNAAQNLEGE